MQANPYTPDNMGSFGKADSMFLRQFKFPNTYTEKDILATADHDRCFMWDHDHARRCFDEHTGNGELAFETWVQRATNEAVMRFLIDILKAKLSIAWTGYRILGTVHRGNGFPVWTLQLFAKHPDSQIKVYSGPNAPNVKVDPLAPKGIYIGIG